MIIQERETFKLLQRIKQNQTYSVYMVNYHRETKNSPRDHRNHLSDSRNYIRDTKNYPRPAQTTPKPPTPAGI